MITISLVLLGSAAGILSGLFGIGGGIVLVPGLIYFLKFEPVEASGTSLISMLLPVGALGVWQLMNAGKIALVHFRYGGWISLGIFFGAFFGAKLALLMPINILQKTFALLLVFAAYRIWMTKV